MKVLRAFKTPIRRFSVGTVITPADIDGPVALEDWVSRGFVADAPKRAPAKPEAPQTKE